MATICDSELNDTLRLINPPTKKRRDSLLFRDAMENVAEITADLQTAIYGNVEINDSEPPEVFWSEEK